MIHHHLFVSSIFSFGVNDNGQCGVGDNSIYIIDPEQPKLITTLTKYVVDVVKCGRKHSLVKTECNKYFMFSNNIYGVCFGDQNEKYIWSPFRVNTILKEKHCIKTIIDIYPGYCNTKILCICMDN